MKILFMSQMPPHSNQSGTSSSVEQLRQYNEQQNSITSNASLSGSTNNLAAQTAELLNSFLPLNTQVDDLSLEQSFAFEDLIMNDLEVNDDETFQFNDMGLKFEIAELPGALADVNQSDETTTLLNSVVNPANMFAETQHDLPLTHAGIPTVPASTQQQQQQQQQPMPGVYNVSSPADSYAQLSNVRNIYGNPSSMLPSSTTTSMIHSTATNSHAENQRLASMSNIIDTKNIKQEYIHHEDSNSSSATYKSEPTISNSKMYYDHPPSVSPSTMDNFARGNGGPSTSGLAYKRSHTKKQQSEEISYGPIVVRPRKNPAPTLASGRKSKSIVLSEDEARKREIRRQRNRNAADKCKQKRAQIEDTLMSDALKLKKEHSDLLQENDRLLAKKRLLEETLRMHTCTSRVSVQQPQQQQVVYNQQAQSVRMMPGTSAVPVMNTASMSYEASQPAHIGYQQQAMSMYQAQSYNQQVVGPSQNMAQPAYLGYEMNMNMPAHQPQQQMPQTYMSQAAGYSTQPQHVYQPSQQQQQQQQPSQMYPPQYN